MSERIETNFEELKGYEKIESYYDYLEQAEQFFRDVFGDRAESQKYIVRANKEIERLHSIIKEVREWANKTIFYFDFEEEITKHAFDLLCTKQGQELLEILGREND